MGERVWAGAPETDGKARKGILEADATPAEQGARVLAKMLLPMPGPFSPPAVDHWALLMDRARELSAIHETRTRLIIEPDQWDLPWAIIYTDPTGVRP